MAQVEAGVAGQCGGLRFWPVLRPVLLVCFMADVNGLCGGLGCQFAYGFCYQPVWGVPFHGLCHGQY